MKNEQFQFLLINQNKNNQEEESDFSEDKKKRNKKFELKKFEKFKPKNNNLLNSKMNLEGAENQVKSLLSIFLKDIEQENQNSDILNNNINNKGQKDYFGNKFKRRDIKRNSVAFSNFNFGKRISHDIKYDGNKKLLNKDSINESNKKNNKKLNSGIVPYLEINQYKKDGINISSINKKNIIINYSNFADNIVSPKKNKISNNFLSLTSSNIESSSPKKKNISKNNTNSSNLLNDFSPSRKSRSHFISSITSSNIEKKPSTNKNKIRKGSSLNDSNYYLLNYNDSQKNSEKSVKRANSNFGQKSLSSFAGGKNQIKNNLVKNRKKSDLSDSNIFDNKPFMNKNSSNNINENSNRNNINKNINNIFKHSINNNTIFSEGSEWNLYQESRDELNKDESNNIINNKDSLLTKQNSGEINTIERKNTAGNSTKLKNKISNELDAYNRAGTNYSEEKKIKNKNKFFKQNKKLKSIKKILKNSIILRPEDMKINLKQKKSNKNLSSSSLVNKIKKEKRKSRSGTNLLQINKNLENLNKSDFGRKNRSSITNIKIKIPKEKKEKVKFKIPEKKTSKKDLIQKEESLKQLPSLKRKNYSFSQKWRVIRRKANLYDSLDDEECEDAEEINHLFIHPNSNIILFFDAILTISSLLSFIVVPLYLAKTYDFCRKETFDIIFLINVFIEFINILDLLLGFFRGYYNWEEQLIYRKRRIMLHYLGNWFLFDLFAAIPVFIINKFNEPYCNNYELNTIRYNHILNNPHYLFLCNRLFKLYKIFNNNQAYKILSNKINDHLSIILIVFVVLFSLNYVGCLYIFIARNCYPNWILTSNLDTSSFVDIYICSIYIIIMAMTTVGYGDITCYSFWERIFQLFILLVGISAYSWSVTSFSNYIKKINEKSADFEKKKQILDEIKLSNQNLPDELYDKILRHLKFKNFHEKKLKNIIFDCLPGSLKNNLICEMYKPIIKNFIFFKNFQNTDFIVRVILAFRPILADKNDILINDNDMVEDIMFVKFGILSVELPINMSNPQENLDKYLNMSVLNPEKKIIEGPGNNTIIYSQLNSKLNNTIKNPNFKSTLVNFHGKSNNNLKPATGFSTILSSGYATNIRTSTFGNNLTISDKGKEKEKDDIRYVKILCIRENEHFGDVMMFLEQRSPLRVRVKSKKAELFFLKKMDAINISTSYPNIWRRINKKSVFNFEQIKKSINKIIDIYCSIKRIDSIEEESSNTSIYSELIKKRKIGKEETEIDLRPKKYELDNPKEIIDEKDNVKRSKSHKPNSNSFIKNILKKNKIEKISSKNIKYKMALSSKRISKNYNIEEIINNNKKNKKLDIKRKLSPILSPKAKKNNNNKKRVKFDQKLDDVYKEKYKFYNKINKNKQNTDSIINEEPSKEDMASRLKSTKSFKYIEKISVSPKSNKYYEKDKTKKFSFESGNSNDNYIGTKKNNIININNLNQIVKRNSKTLKLDDSSSMHYINDENCEKSEENRKKPICYDKTINNEINPGEEIKINKEENLFFRKVNFLNPIKNYSHLNNLNNSIEFKKSKVDFLLNSFSESELDKNINNNINNQNINNNINNNKNMISDNSSNSIESIKNNELNKVIIDNNKASQIKKWDKKSLKIFSNISLKYESSYENCNLICGKKLIKNKFNQYKLKAFLIEEILNKNVKNRNSFFQLSHKEITNISLNQKEIEKENKEKKSSILKNSFYTKQIKKKLQKSSSLLGDSTMLSSNFKPSSINRTSSFNENIRGKNRLMKNSFQDDFNDIGNMTLARKRTMKLTKKKLSSSKNTSKYFNIFNSAEKNKKAINKNASLKSPYNKTKKKKDNLLSKINFNIQKTNQNLNNPDEFYSNYFHSILEEEAAVKNKMFGMSMKVLPKMKKDKNTLKKNLTLRK